MLALLSNTPRDSAWGSPTLIAELEGREPSGAPEAEVWFGDHPGSPAVVEDGSGRPLDEWLAEEGATGGAPARLPYLLKLLAAASTLSIQAHPSKAQAERGFARENAAGQPAHASDRSYQDDNHKPELIVALSDRFEALAGLRDLDATLALFTELEAASSAAGASFSAGVASLRERLSAPAALGPTIGWLLSGEAQRVVDDVIAAASLAASLASSDRFGAELELSRRLAAQYPGDAGVVVALLMNLVTLRRGEAVFVPAGVLHAYQSGLGVELMAASDNVLRGGLTPKHIDVDELLRVLDVSTGPAPVLAPVAIAPGIEAFAPPVPDFALLRVDGGASAAGVEVSTSGVAIVLATAGEVTLTGARTAEPVVLRPGQALLATPDESPLRVSGGEAFIAEPGF